MCTLTPGGQPGQCCHAARCRSRPHGCRSYTRRTARIVLSPSSPSISDSRMRSLHPEDGPVNVVTFRRRIQTSAVAPSTRRTARSMLSRVEAQHHLVFVILPTGGHPGQCCHHSGPFLSQRAAALIPGGRPGQCCHGCQEPAHPQGNAESVVTRHVISPLIVSMASQPEGSPAIAVTRASPTCFESALSTPGGRPGHCCYKAYTYTRRRPGKCRHEKNGLHQRPFYKFVPGRQPGYGCHEKDRNPRHGSDNAITALIVLRYETHTNNPNAAGEDVATTTAAQSHVFGAPRATGTMLLHAWDIETAIQAGQSCNAGALI
jgi:hypothetical protein